ncbi:MAG: hypothetical protein H6696_00535 [Deferribacteres bacterium]|nr:hypothetical protein [candidate division KSB1 bacterium]MCB9500392.1 hypothetical protein [Deferribacteres bacterium]
MSFGQLTIILLACVSVSKAFIYFGELEYRGKWLNYVIAILGGILGARIGLMIPALNSVALLVAIASAIGLLAVYQLLRWRLIHWRALQKNQTVRSTPAWQIR